jgi:hypothetical protein
MLFKNEDPKLNKYNDIMAEAGQSLLEAEMLLDSFMENVVADYKDRIFDIEMEIPGLLMNDEKSFSLKRISAQEETGMIEIELADQSNTKIKIQWTDLNIVNKNHIANYIHLNLLSADIYKNLS